MTSIRTENRPAASLAAFATLCAAGAAWFVALRRMNGMDMGPGTPLGSFSFFVTTWTLMMLAMMLPSVLPAIVAFERAARRFGRIGFGALVFAVGYIAVWTVVGIAAYGVDRGVRSAHPGFLAWNRDGPYIVAAIAIAAGLYELCPLKRACLRRCRAASATSAGRTPAGLRYGVDCLGCSAGLMLILFAVGVMSVTWMLVVAALLLFEKVAPVGQHLVAPVAVFLIVIGVSVVIDPSSFV